MEAGRRIIEASRHQGKAAAPRSAATRRLCAGKQAARAILALILLPFAACDRGTDNTGAHAAGQSISHRVEEGPVQATITLEPREVRTSGSLRLIVEVAIPAPASVETIQLDEALPEDWVITDRGRSARGAGTKRVERFEFTVEPYLPGRHEIDSFEINCDLRGDAGERLTLHSMAVPVEVVSEWPAGDVRREPAALRGVVEPPPRPWPWWAWAGAGGGVLLIAAAIAWIVRRRRRPCVLPPVHRAAHDVALADLGRLIAAQLMEQGQYKAFYQRLCDILRRYLENRFGLRAPERTTEEFLLESRHARCFNSGDLQLLEEFLTHCDMVKFAEFVPDRVRMNESLDTVRAFIERTKSAEAQVEVSPARLQRRRGRRAASEASASASEAEASP